MNDTERDLLLTNLKNDVEWIRISLANHLEHHFRWNIAAMAFAGSAIIALIVVVLKTT